jgi:hypothetical protein
LNVVEEKKPPSSPSAAGGLDVSDASPAVKAVFGKFLSVRLAPDPFELDPFEPDPFEPDPFEPDPFSASPYQSDRRRPSARCFPRASPTSPALPRRC